MDPEQFEAYLESVGIRDPAPWYRPRYNIAPSQHQVVIAERAGKREARLMRWGLVPSWAKDPKIGNSMVNARAETIGIKPAYREALSKRRGLIVADSYYEWSKTPTGLRPIQDLSKG